MTAKLYKLMALALALLIVSSGCSLIEVDMTMDAAEPVAVVNGVGIPKSEVQASYEYAAQYYQYYGLSEESAKSSARESVVNAAIDAELERQKAEELGLTTLTDEEAAEAKTAAESDFATFIEQYRAQAAPDETDEEKAREAVLAYVKAQYGEDVTVDSYLESAERDIWKEKLRKSVIADVELTDEALASAYDEKVAADKTNYEANAYTFEYNMSQGNLVTWIPEGYRTVKHILLKYTDEQSAALTELTAELEDVEEKIAALTAEVEPDAEATAEPEATPEAEAEPDATEAPVVTQADLEGLKAEVEGKIEAKHAEILASFQTKIDEINSRLAAGESFDALMEELGEDPGMQSEPAKTTGYYVSAKSELWETGFTEGAMALEKAGDVSAPVFGSNGIHLITYVGDVASGAVPFETVAEQLRETTLTKMQDDAYTAALASWKEAASIKTYTDRLS